jgi:hypothetical protein
MDPRNGGKRGLIKILHNCLRRKTSSCSLKVLYGKDAILSRMAIEISPVTDGFVNNRLLGYAVIATASQCNGEVQFEFGWKWLCL